MRPLRTAVITAALRRTTQRWVFGGGRSSLIARASGGDRSRALVTGSRPDVGGPERSIAHVELLAARLTAQCRIALQPTRSVAPDVAWVGSALAVGQRAIPLRRIKAATDASIFLAIHLIFPIDLVSLGNAEPQSDLAQQDKIFNNIYP
jgi:hypothetical protein